MALLHFSQCPQYDQSTEAPDAATVQECSLARSAHPAAAVAEAVEARGLVSGAGKQECLVRGERDAADALT